MRYVLTERIARGGMAEIHLGKAIGGDDTFEYPHICAFKRILPEYAHDSEFVSMFRNEARVAQNLTHPNIVRVSDVVLHEGRYMLVMEYVDGKDLRSLMVSVDKQKRRFPIEIACYIIQSVLAGLDYAHTVTDQNGQSLNIVHRDISPQNALLSWDGEVKVTDFGIAKARTQSSATKAGVLKGKFRYMSPEQAWGKPIDPRSDLYSVGIMFWEMLTMKRLFDGDSDVEVLNKVRESRILRPSAVRKWRYPERVEAIVLKLLSKEAGTRYQSAKEAYLDLRSCLYELKSTFTQGDLKEFLSEIFPGEIEASRERIRSTLALPTGSIAQTYNAPRSQVLDISDKNASSVPSSGTPGQLGGGNYFPRSPSAAVSEVSEYSLVPKKASMQKGSMLEVKGGRRVSRQDINLGIIGSPGKPRVGGRPSTAYHGRRLGASSRKSSSTTVFVFFVGTLIAALTFILVGMRTGMVGAPTYFRIITTPAKGKIRLTLDGVPVQGGGFLSVPYTLKMKGGGHEIVIYKEGFKPKSFQYKAPYFGKKVQRIVPLERAHVLGNVRVQSIPEGATLNLANGMDIGKSPYTFEYLVVGKVYDILVSHPSCPVSRFKLTVPRTSQNHISLKLIRLKGCR